VNSVGRYRAWRISIKMGSGVVGSRERPFAWSPPDRGAV
jgi:hypothetical protein